jgi:hypothetical protein
LEIALSLSQYIFVSLKEFCDVAAIICSGQFFVCHLII